MEKNRKQRSKYIEIDEAIWEDRKDAKSKREREKKNDLLVRLGETEKTGLVASCPMGNPIDNIVLISNVM